MAVCWITHSFLQKRLLCRVLAQSRSALVWNLLAPVVVKWFVSHSAVALPHPR